MRNAITKVEEQTIDHPLALFEFTSSHMIPPCFILNYPAWVSELAAKVRLSINSFKRRMFVLENCSVLQSIGQSIQMKHWYPKLIFKHFAFLSTPPSKGLSHNQISKVTHRCKAVQRMVQAVVLALALCESKQLTKSRLGQSAQSRIQKIILCVQCLNHPRSMDTTGAAAQSSFSSACFVHRLRRRFLKALQPVFDETRNYPQPFHLKICHVRRILEHVRFDGLSLGVVWIKA